LYVEDLAEAILLAAERYNKPEPVNIGSGHEITIRELAALLCKLTGFEGELIWDRTQPDGQPRQTSLVDGLRNTIEWYRNCGTPLKSRT
jgi:GDP-L-fucose synthase